MEARTLLTTLAAGAALLVGGALLAPAIAQDGSPSATAAAPAGDGLTIPQVLERLEAAGYRDFKEVERERDRYEVKATDAEGRRVEVYVDAATGEIVKTEVKRSK